MRHFALLVHLYGMAVINTEKEESMSVHPTSTIGRAIRRVAIPAVIGVLALASVGGPATARTTIDPSTLNPAPPDFFNAQCYAGAGGTVCTLAFSDDPFFGEPSGIVCDGTELLISQERSVVGKRFYDADGDLLQRHFREYMGGTLTNPDTHGSVPWSQHDTIIHDLSVPGDLDSGSTKITGLMTRALAPGGGTILVDAGTIVEDTGTGELLQAGGPHPFRDYFVGGDASALQAICDAVD